MKWYAFAIILVLIAGGCASPPRTIPPKIQIANKHDEIVVLQSEIDQLTRGLFALQDELANRKQSMSQNTMPKLYAEETQAEDLDRTIKILRQARDQLSEQQKTASSSSVQYQSRVILVKK